MKVRTTGEESEILRWATIPSDNGSRITIDFRSTVFLHQKLTLQLDKHMTKFEMM